MFEIPNRALPFDSGVTVRHKKKKIEISLKGLNSDPIDTKHNKNILQIH